MTRWHRNAVVMTVLAVVAFWLLIPEPPAVESWREFGWRDHPEIVTAIRGATELDRRTRALEQRETRAVARAAITGARLTGDLTISADPGVPAGTRAHFDSVARRELAIAGAARVPIVVHLGIDTVKGHVYAYSRAVVIPRTATAPCGVTVIAPASRIAQMRLSDEDRLLGACAFYARFGSPGAGMQRWLIDTRQLAAGFLTEPPTMRSDTALVSLTQPYQDAWTLRGCRAGDRRLCDLVFTPTREVSVFFENERPDRATASWDFGDVAVNYPGKVSNTYARMGEGLLGALAADLGPARFEALWTAAEAPSAAYARLEGRPLAEWTAARAERLLEPYRRGPAVPLGPWVVGLSLLLAGWLGSTRFVDRRMS